MQRCWFSAPEHAVIDVGLRCPHRWTVLPGSEEQQSRTESSKTERTISFSVYCMLNTFFTGQEEKLSSSLTIMIHAICDSASLFIALLVMAPSPYKNGKVLSEFTDNPLSLSFFIFFPQTILKYF